MELERFDSREAASQAAADRLVAALERRLSAQNEASLVVSGGSTPKRCFELLSEADLDWDKVVVVLSDERWVPPDHPDSNERFVRETLLRGRAAAATLLSAWQDGVSAAERSTDAEVALRQIPFPFAGALLGMGADGHFASLFPDADNLADGLDTESSTLALPVSTAASPHQRISMTLSPLSRSDEIVLLIFGDDKRQTLDAALAPESTLPVAKLLKQKRAPVQVIWAP
ncbi:MAG: 6-phosphogluconolactonase [Woeseiaceae bacterium]|nr:6-phosphogluconolactonase [Woeseiaceae bacterium]